MSAHTAAVFNPCMTFNYTTLTSAWVLVTLTLLSLPRPTTAVWYPGRYVMDGDTGCNTSVVLQENQDMRIQMTSKRIEAAKFNCFLTITGPDLLGHTLRAHFRRFTSPQYQTDCDTLAIQLMSNNETKLPPYCSTFPPRAVYDLGSRAVVNVVSKSRPAGGQQKMILPLSFDLLVSSVAVKGVASLNHTCPANYFSCWGGKTSPCVHNDLTCNDFDDCGNNSDESLDYCSGIPGGILAALVISAIFVTLVTLIVGRRVYTWRRVRREYAHMGVNM